jgi:hypothetical protein
MKKAKSIGSENKSDCQGMEVSEGRLTTKDHQATFWSDGNSLDFDCGNYMTICFSKFIHCIQNSYTGLVSLI